MKIRVRVRGQRNKCENRRFAAHRRRQPKAIVRRRSHQKLEPQVTAYVLRQRERYWSNPEVFRAQARRHYHALNPQQRSKRLAQMAEVNARLQARYVETQRLYTRARAKAKRLGGTVLDHLEMGAWMKAATERQRRYMELRLQTQPLRAQAQPPVTDRDLARASGCSVATIRAWHRGKIELPPGAVQALKEAGYGKNLLPKAKQAQSTKKRYASKKRT